MNFSEDYKREILFIFFSQKRFILRVTGAIFIISVLIAFFWPPTYGAFGSILLKSKKITQGPETLQESEYRAYPTTMEDLLSELEILISPDVLQKTIASLKKADLPPDLKESIAELVEDPLSIQNKLSPEIVPGSHVIKVAYFHKNPKIALLVLDTIMKQYIFYRASVYNSSQEGAFFSEQLTMFEKSYVDKQAELEQLVKKTNIANPLKEIDTNIEIKRDLEGQLNILETAAIDKKLLKDQIEKVLNDQNVQAIPFIDNPSINELNKRISELYIERGNMLRTYSESNENVKAMDKQIESIANHLKSQVLLYQKDLSTKIDIINAQIKSINSKLENLSAHNIALHRQMMDSQKLEAEITLLRYSYETFYKRREESKISSSVSAANLPLYVGILSNANVPEEPVFPVKPIVICLGLVVGFFTGCSLGFLRDYFDHTFKKASDVQKYSGLSVIGSIPFQQQ